MNPEAKKPVSPLRELIAKWMLGLESVSVIIGLQLGLGQAKRAMESARKLDQAYERAGGVAPPEYTEQYPGLGLPPRLESFPYAESLLASVEDEPPHLTVHSYPDTVEDVESTDSL